MRRAPALGFRAPFQLRAKAVSPPREAASLQIPKPGRQAGLREAAKAHSCVAASVSEVHPPGDVRAPPPRPGASFLPGVRALCTAGVAARRPGFQKPPASATRSGMGLLVALRPRLHFGEGPGTPDTRPSPAPATRLLLIPHLAPAPPLRAGLGPSCTFGPQRSRFSSEWSFRKGHTKKQAQC